MTQENLDEQMYSKADLVSQLKVLLATTFSFYLKSHNYHWNVTGPNFAQYHEFFGDLYEEVFASVDTTAEEIRKHGAYAPGSLGRFADLSLIEDELTIPDPDVMFARLARDNDTLIDVLYQARSIADQIGENGTVNYIEDRISAHEKHRWMIKSF